MPLYVFMYGLILDITLLGIDALVFVCLFYYFIFSVVGSKDLCEIFHFCNVLIVGSCIDVDCSIG